MSNSSNTKLDLPANPIIATRVIETEHRQNTQRMERGLMGAIFGLSHEKPGNIAGFVILAILAMYAGVYFFGKDVEGLSRKDIMLSLTSLLTLTLGYVFGRTSSSKGD